MRSDLYHALWVRMREFFRNESETHLLGDVVVERMDLMEEEVFHAIDELDSALYLYKIEKRNRERSQ